MESSPSEGVLGRDNCSSAIGTACVGWRYATLRTLFFPLSQSCMVIMFVCANNSSQVGTRVSLTSPTERTLGPSREGIRWHSSLFYALATGLAQGRILLDPLPDNEDGSLQASQSRCGISHHRVSNTTQTRQSETTAACLPNCSIATPNKDR